MTLTNLIYWRKIYQSGVEIKMKKLILFGIVIVLLSFFVSANVKLNVNNDKFSFGDKVIVELTIDNPYQYDAEFEVHSLISSSDRDFIPRQEFKRVSLDAGKSNKIVLYSFVIDDNFKKGDYNVNVEVSSSRGKIGSDGFSFEIMKGTEVFDFDVFACKDFACSERSNTFLVDDEIFINYGASVDVELDAVLIKNKRKKEITLPYFLGNPKLGNYVVEVIAFKEGYKTETDKFQFTILKSHADFSEKSVVGIVDSGDRHSIPDLEEQLYKNNYLLTVLLSIVLVVAVIFLLNFVLKLKDGEKSMILNLESYILNAKAQGFKKAKIKRVLKRSGWRSEEIERAFKLIKK